MNPLQRIGAMLAGVVGLPSSYRNDTEWERMGGLGELAGLGGPAVLGAITKGTPIWKLAQGLANSVKATPKTIPEAYRDLDWPVRTGSPITPTYQPFITTDLPPYSPQHAMAQNVLEFANEDYQDLLKQRVVPLQEVRDLAEEVRDARYIMTIPRPRARVRLDESAVPDVNEAAIQGAWWRSPFIVGPKR